MSAQTPGQAAYEAYADERAKTDPRPVDWKELGTVRQGAWEAAAQAGVKPASAMYVLIPLSVAKRMALTLKAMAEIMRVQHMSTASIVQEDGNLLDALTTVAEAPK